MSSHPQQTSRSLSKVAVSGANGLIGRAVCEEIRRQGGTVCRLVRKPVQSDEEIEWNTQAGLVSPEQAAGLSAVIHLAGENIAEGRWTAAKKKRIRESRVSGTKVLCESMAQLPEPPEVFVGASAIGFYGDRGDEWLQETSPPGTGFLSQLCQDWEAAAEPLHQVGTRITHIRIGLVLSPSGGALAKMLFPFRLGLGGRIGNGQQYWSWIVLDDLARIFVEAITDGTYQGPVNGVAPEPVTNREFTRILGRTLHRPILFPLPAFVLKLLLGEMADELLLSSTRVQPTVLESHRFSFQYRTLSDGLSALLCRS